MTDTAYSSEDVTFMSLKCLAVGIKLSGNSYSGLIAASLLNGSSICRAKHRLPSLKSLDNPHAKNIAMVHKPTNESKQTALVKGLKLTELWTVYLIWSHTDYEQMHVTYINCMIPARYNTIGSRINFSLPTSYSKTNKFGLLSHEYFHKCEVFWCNCFNDDMQHMMFDYCTNWWIFLHS